MLFIFTIIDEILAAKDFFLSSLTFLILFNNLIPISLIVTQEVSYKRSVYCMRGNWC